MNSKILIKSIKIVSIKLINKIFKIFRYDINTIILDLDLAMSLFIRLKINILFGYYILFIKSYIEKNQLNSDIFSSFFFCFA